jgi:hypothetical protein
MRGRGLLRIDGNVRADRASLVDRWLRRAWELSTKGAAAPKVAAGGDRASVQVALWFELNARNTPIVKMLVAGLARLLRGDHDCVRWDEL